jgi:hypothetical protein
MTTPSALPLSVQRKEVEDCVETLIAKLLRATKDASLKVIIYVLTVFVSAHVCDAGMYIVGLSGVKCRSHCRL